MAQQLRDPDGERERLLDELRSRVLANPRQPIGVDALAAERGMSRSHFSHDFRARTGLSPARFMTEVRIQEAARMLVATRAPAETDRRRVGLRQREPLRQGVSPLPAPEPGRLSARDRVTRFRSIRLPG